MYGDHRSLPVLTHSFPTRRSSDLDLVDLHQHGVALSTVDAALEPLHVGDEQVVADQLGAGAELVGDRLPTVPVLLVEGVLDRDDRIVVHAVRSEEHTSELQSLMRISYAVFCLNKKKYHTTL